ncbi:MAG: glycosyltransferase family 2 protein [Muribaculaceae bacterium]|nr:glycosyltransferase family 2 protein [Muribaculaceae bacterium]
MKITAVVVTYNRLALLRQCIKSLRNQTRQVDEIIVINNCSTDGTADFLDEIAATCPEIKPTTLPSNVGGAGGFEAGMGMAIEQGADRVWIMDDDTLPTPTALERLLAAEESDPRVGFTCSRVEWTDGSMHLMNKPLFKGRRRPDRPIDEVTSTIECNAATFVSLLVKREVVVKVGLPIGEYFIWHDDIEYTSRILRAGYTGLYVPDSVVIHSTAHNLGATIVNAPAGTEKRFYYQVRNQVATKRMNASPIAAAISNRLRLHRFKRNVKKRRDNRDLFMEQVLKGYRDGLHFNPVIHFPKVDK